MTTAYQQRVNSERLERQAPEVQKIAKEILEELKGLERCLYWAIDPEDDPMQWTASMIERAHALVDQTHEYRAALKADPPPKEEENGDDAA